MSFTEAGSDPTLSDSYNPQRPQQDLCNLPRMLMFSVARLKQQMCVFQAKC